CREADITGQAAQEELPDLAGAPVRFVAFEADDEALELGGELVGVMDGSAGAVGEGLEAMLLLAVKGFVTGFSGNAGSAAKVGHGLAVEEPSNETQAFFHDRTLLPGHWHLPAVAGGKCYPCVRYDLSPVSRVAHNHLGRTSFTNLVARSCNKR